jgi:hypothetical protein
MMILSIVYSIYNWLYMLILFNGVFGFISIYLFVCKIIWSAILIPIMIFCGDIIWLFF